MIKKIKEKYFQKLNLLMLQTREMRNILKTIIFVAKIKDEVIIT